MGNTAFKSNDLPLGLQKYTKALRYLNEYPAPLENDPPELWPALQSLKISLYTNSALLQNKTGAYSEAADSATKALSISNIGDKEAAKAYFRRAQAKAGRKNDEDALEDLNAALKHAPGDASITKEVEVVKKRVATRKEKEKKAFKNAFNF